MWIDEELDKKTADAIEKLFKEGEALENKKQYDDAINKYLEALSLVPEDKKEWAASTWSYISLGSICYAKKDYEAAKNYFYDARNCLGGLENPYVLLRIGEAHAESGEIEKAKEFMFRAFLTDSRIFSALESKKCIEMSKFILNRDKAGFDNYK